MVIGPQKQGKVKMKQTLYADSGVPKKLKVSETPEIANETFNTETSQLRQVVITVVYTLHTTHLEFFVSYS